MKKVIIAIVAFSLIGVDAMGKKKDNEVLEEKVVELNQKIDSLENALLKQRIDLSDKITNLYQIYNELKSSYEKLEKGAKSESNTANPQAKIDIVGNINCGLAAAKAGAMYGYVNARCEMVIQPTFEVVKEFENNYAKVRKNGRWGVIDTLGNIVVPCEFVEIEEYNPALNIYRVRSDKDLWGLMSPGKTVQVCKYLQVHTPRYKRAMFCDAGKWGYFDEQGKIAIYAKYTTAYSFEENGTAVVYDPNLRRICIDKLGRKVADN